jgi:hypothetical protein
MLMAGSEKKCITPSPGLFKKIVTESGRYSYTGMADDDTYMRAIVLMGGKNKATEAEKAFINTMEELKC